MIELLKNKISFIKRKYKSEKKSYSFGGCDLIIDYIFKSQDNGFYVDVGCQHPITNNNTYLLHQKNWKGINIDLDDKNIRLFNSHRPKDTNICACLSSKEQIRDLYFFHSGSPINSIEKKTVLNKQNFSVKKIKTSTLNSILKSHKPKKIDYLNIDVEGHEIEVLNGFDINHFKPSVISVEFLDFNMVKMEFKNNNLTNVVNSDLYNFFIQNDYHFVNWLHGDLIFVHKDFRD